ncbi:MAG: hypothetical protein LBF12_07290 [Christensenellaceae bacterium]|jgi:hypothetical protein|nr:hypothetical protein [Christensenellaceae bacterium]
MVDLSYLVAFIIIALLGLLLGFGKILKIFTSGPFGLIISIIFCAFLGGTLQSVPFIADFITSINQKAIDIASFFQYIKPGIVVYYIVMFLIVQIFRMFVVKLIKTLMEIEKPAIKLLNRILGLVFSVAFSSAFLLLFFAVVEIFDSTQFGQNIILKLGDGIIRGIYDNNPINFVIN